MTAPIGREVSLTMDGFGRIVEGDYLVQVTTRRTYLVTAARVVSRGPNAGRRQRLRAVVVPEDHPEPGDRVLEFVWRPRSRR